MGGPGDPDGERGSHAHGFTFAAPLTTTMLPFDGLPQAFIRERNSEPDRFAILEGFLRVLSPANRSGTATLMTLRVASVASMLRCLQIVAF